MRGLCPDCLKMHTSDTPCPTVLCGRCGELMYHAGEAEDCRDPICPLHEPQELPNALTGRQMHRTSAPWRK